ncbi:MAG TPA: XRE family transcriptional regulator [Gaiellaceae bacterium]|jgi:transcriptional regulator with XRE-family HTH domain|nr:XRE family transcriptional regulator [Gaiellaceae bacterium]
MPSSAPDVRPEVDVGERLRDIRRHRRATLKTIADRAGVSESFLSQVERGRASASIASLRRIAGALGVSVADLFEPGGPPQPRVLRRDDRPSLAFGILGRKLLLTPRPLQHLEVFAGELDVGGSTGSEAYAHGDSEELFVVLSGTVQLELGGALFELEQGDSIDYRSSTPHRATNVGQERAEVMWIISPPSY